ncbi:MAG TPA: HAMP domain-containing sensor histidine kinase [Crinalium sp.]
MGQLKWGRLDFSSLQFRLTLGIALVAILGVGGVATWTSVRMNQMLIDSHEQAVILVANRLPVEIERYQTDSPETAVQQAVDRLSPPDLLLWIEGNDNRVLAESMAFKMSPDRAELIASAAMPTQPEVQAIEEHYFILCGGKLWVREQPIGWFYMAKDITHDYLALSSLQHTLRVSALIAIALIIITMAFWVWRSLRPLRQMSQISASHAPMPVKRSRLNPEHMPGEIKALAQTCNELMEQLSETDKQQRQFACDISHELRTPLSLVYGYLQSTLRRGSNLTTPQQEALGIAVSETERTIELLQNLLDVVRTDSFSKPFTIESVVLDDVSREVADLAEKQNHRSITIEPDDAPVRVQADRTYLKQVLLQLVNNAIKYSPSDQPIVLKLMQTSGWGIVQVSDRGCGIPLVHQSRIFEPFYRVDPSRCRQTGGTGLGLSIAKSLVEGMGGRVTVQSEPNRGSTFSVALPSHIS